MLYKEIQSLHPKLIAFVNNIFFSVLKPDSLFTWKNYYEALNFKEEGGKSLFLFFFFLAGFWVMLCVKTKALTDTTNFSSFFFLPQSTLCL